MESVLDAARPGRLALGVVEGEPGIGKSRLLAEALRRRGDLRVLSARPTAMDTERPFAAISEALGTEAALPGSDPAALHREVDAAVDAVEEAALRGPVVLVADDLQWFDAASALVLRAITRRLVGVPLALLVATRPSRESYQVIVSLGMEATAWVRLGPLPAADVDEIVTRGCGAPPDQELRDHVGKAAGNPLFVTELVRSLVAERKVEVTAGGAFMTDPSFPESLGVTLRRRLSVLPAATVEVLRAASILGRQFTLEDLAFAVEASASELAGALRPALDASVIEADGEALRFRHDLIRDAIYDELPRAIRAGLHVELARKLAAAGARAERVATHFAIGARPGDAEAVRWLRRAAAEAETTPAIPIDLLTRALALAGPRHPDRHQMELDLARSLLAAGRANDAETLARSLLDRVTGPEEDAAHRLLVQALFTQGRWTAELQAIEDALARAHEPQTRARLKAEASLTRLFLGDAEGAERDGTEAVEEAQALGDDVAESVALGHLAATAAARGDGFAGVAFSQRAIETARSEEARARHPHLSLCVSFADADELDAAVEMCRVALRLAEEQGAVWAVPLYQTFLALDWLTMGAWDDAVTAAEAGLAAGEETGSHTVAFAAHTALATVAIHRSNPTEAQARLELAARIESDHGTQWGDDWNLRAQALITEVASGPAEALAALRAHCDAFETAGNRSSQLLVATEVLRLAAIEDRGAAAAVGRVAEEVATFAATPFVEAIVHLSAGVTEADAGRARRASAILRDRTRPREAAIALECAGRVAGGTEEAAAAFDEAAAIYHDLGAKADVARIGAALRAAGLRRGSRVRRAQSRTGWASLTPTELDVVRLAAEGLTNPQIGGQLFMSRHTVATHLSHVFAKLGIGSRVELATEAARQGLRR